MVSVEDLAFSARESRLRRLAARVVFAAVVLRPVGELGVLLGEVGQPVLAKAIGGRSEVRAAATRSKTFASG